MRAISLRTARTRPVFSSWPFARWKRRLNCSFFSFTSCSLSSSADLPRKSSGVSFFFAMVVIRSESQPRDELRRDRKLRRTQTHRLFRGLEVDTVDLEKNAARLDLGDPEFRRALARAHAYFGRLLRHRHVREHADPHAARTLHLTRDGTTRGFDLARSDPLRLRRLQAEGAEVERGTGL